MGSPTAVHNTLSDVGDLPLNALFFLTQRGTAYNYEVFKWHWRKVYPQARKHCPIDFSPLDLRHLLVTELPVQAQATWELEFKGLTANHT
jgi:hypothetical protein